MPWLFLPRGRTEPGPWLQGPSWSCWAADTPLLREEGTTLTTASPLEARLPGRRRLPSEAGEHTRQRLLSGLRAPGRELAQWLQSRRRGRSVRPALPSSVFEELRTNLAATRHHESLQLSSPAAKGVRLRSAQRSYVTTKAYPELILR